MTVSATVGRRVLILIVIVACISAFVTEIIRGGGGQTGGDTTKQLIQSLLRIFVPMFGVIAAFLFAERSDGAAADQRSTSIETFAFACFVVGAWAFLPTIAMFVYPPLDDTITTIDRFEIFGNSISIAGLTFYFSSTANAKAATPPAR